MFAMQVDYLVIGSGLTGAVIARVLKDAGKDVLVVERRPHIGGNVFDYVHPCGIRIHSYGPHYFRTSSEIIWKFVNRFTSFDPYEAVIKSWVDGKYENWPVTKDYINKTVGNTWQPEFKGKPTNFEEAALSLMPRLIYEKFVKGYTEKQWGVPCYKLSSSLIKRFQVNETDDPRLKSDKYQGIPTDGYQKFMSAILSNVPILLNLNYLENKNIFQVNKMLIFTGAIDEFFNFDLGYLKYRSQKREHTYFTDVEFILPCGQVNNPDPNNGPDIRTLEWKHMMPKQYSKYIRSSVLTKEITYTPNDPNEYEYPFPDNENRHLYLEYERRALQIPKLLICGRLGEYKYYDMDQAIARALALSRRILDTEQ